MALDMDRINKVESFEEMAMSDPFAPEKGLSLAKDTVANLVHNVSIYQGHIQTELAPPKVIFLLTRELFRKMIKATIIYGGAESSEAFFMRFGLLENNH